MKHYHCLQFLLFILIPSTIFGQNPLGIPLVNNYNKVVFQGGSRTWDIKQDSRGIMYFANNDGLISFDGKYWKRQILPNRSILRSIYVDKNDRIYVGGQGEFGYFEGSRNTGLKYFSLQNLIPADYRKFADIWNTVIFGQSAFFRAENVIFELKEDYIKVYPASSGWEFMGEAGGRLFAQDVNNGLLEFRNNKWSLVSETNTFRGLKISSVFAVGKDRIVVATSTNKTYILHNNKVERLDIAPWRDLYTPSLAKINDLEYAVATATEGCLIRNLEGHVLQRISITEGLQNKNISTVFVDKQKNIWVGQDNAIAVISYGSAVRYFRPHAEYDVTGYSTRVFENKLYLSSSNGVYVAPLSTKYKDHSLSPGSFSLVSDSDRGEAWRLEEINGQLLLMHNRGLFTIKDKVATPIASGKGSWLLLPLSAVYPVQHMLVGTYQGIDLLRYTNGRFHHAGTLAGQADSYRFLEQDEQGNTWASHPYRGIYQCRILSNVTAYKARLFTKKDGLPSDFGNYVFKIKNRVLFTTENGIYEFDTATQRFAPSKRFEMFKGVPIRYLKDDADGNFWFCSGKKVGVAQYRAKTGRYVITYFPEIEGLNTSGFENIYPYDSKNIYIGSEKGIFHINYEKYKNNASKPKVLLSSVVTTVRKDSIIFGGYFHEKEGAKFVQDRREIPTLNSAFDSFRFEYSSPSYGIHEQMTYSYWLEGYEMNWSGWTTSTEKAYTNLPSGTYTFKVKARNNLYEESEIVTYTFEIRPPWYRSNWAILGLVVLILIAIYLIVRWQQKAWDRQQQEFDRQLAQLRYIHQLEIEKNEKEIFKLQNEKLENEVLSKTQELANASMHLMENSGALTKLRVELAKLDVGGEEGGELKRITSLLKDVKKNNAHWDQFASHFDELNDGFLRRLKIKHPILSRNDLKVCAYLRLNFSSKQIAQLQTISVRGVEIHRYRIRRKLGIGTELSMSDYLSNI